jgi:hypothetical protein
MKNMKRRLTAAAAILVFTSLAAATPARAASICDQSSDSSFSAWFAHTFGYCNGPR